MHTIRRYSILHSSYLSKFYGAEEFHFIRRKIYFTNVWEVQVRTFIVCQYRLCLFDDIFKNITNFNANKDCLSYKEAKDTCLCIVHVCPSFCVSSMVNITDLKYRTHRAVTVLTLLT